MRLAVLSVGGEHCLGQRQPRAGYSTDDLHWKLIHRIVLVDKRAGE
jgi:hypothetical protein